MIIAVSHRGDAHVEAVGRAIEGLPCHFVVLDLADFPNQGRITIEHGIPGQSAWLGMESGEIIETGEIGCIWWRRPQPYTLDTRLSGMAAEFAREQVNEAFCGLWSTLGATWVNEPYVTQRASHKVGQLALAGRVGFTIPRTTITSDPADAQAFLESLGGRRAIFKPLRGLAECWKPTCLVTAENLARLQDIRLSPVILQEYVDGVDVRLTVIGDDIFATLIDARRTTSPHDFRAAFAESKVSRLQVPSVLGTQVLRMMKDLSLEYAAFDFRLRDDGTFVFLEVNPAGQWLFVEARTGQPITGAFAAHLARADKSHLRESVKRLWTRPAFAA